MERLSYRPNIVINYLNPNIYMSQEEKYIAFLNERIEMASSVETASAYVICKEVFIRLFKPKTDAIKDTK